MSERQGHVDSRFGCVRYVLWREGTGGEVGASRTGTAVRVVGLDARTARSARGLLLAH